MSFRKTSTCLALLAVTIARPGPARAQAPSTADSVLQGLIDEALARNAELAATRQLETAALARPAQASSRPGPALGAMYQNDGIAPSLGRQPMTLLGVTAGQEIPYPGKLALRREVAQADAALAAFDVERAQRSLIASVKRAYYGLGLARGLADLALQHRDVWREVQETARVRFASAAGSQQELLRAQIEATRLQALHAQHHAEARARLAQLNALRARPVDTPVETPATVSLVPETRTSAEVVAWSEAESPELKAARAAVEREERALALAQLAFKPDFTVQGGYMFRGSLPPMWQAGASVALPSRSRARAAVTEAEAHLAASNSRVEDVRIRLQAAVEQRLAFIQAAQTIAATYRDGVLAQDDVAVQSARARYGAGQASQTSVLDAAAALIEDRTDYLRLLAAEAMEQARLEEASLEAPMGIDSLLMHGRSASADGGGMAPPPAMPPSRTTTTSSASPETK